MKTVLCTLFAAATAHAQFGGANTDFSTAGSDAHRSSWIRSDAKISRTSLQKPGFQLVWKVKLNNEARQSSSLTPAALLPRYIGYRGFRALGFVGGSSDKVFAFDTDLGHIEWQKALTVSGTPAACSGGMTANVTRQVSTSFTTTPGRFGGGGGRASFAKSAVGEPDEGAVTVKDAMARLAAAAAAPPPAGGRGGNPFGGRRRPDFLYAITSDGMLHAMYVSNGEEPEPPVKFLPANANPIGLTVINNVAYAVTSATCGGAPNAVWALDLATKEVATGKSPSGAIAGPAGAAFGPDGTVYIATDSGELVSLDSKTLQPKDIYKAGVGFTSSPLIFQHKESTMVAVASKDGHIHVVDAAKMGGPAVVGQDAAANSLATWQDTAGIRYLLSAGKTGLTALKFDGAALEKAWTRPITAPVTPLVINGVVFAASSGDKSTSAVLYALDAGTGTPMWDSGKTITSYVNGGGISGGGSQVYLGTHDGTFYAFGFPIEH